MIVSSATNGSAWFLDGLSRIEARQLKTQRELSTGYRVQDASDAPVETPTLVRLSGSLNAAQVWQANLANLSSETQAGDQAIGSALDVVNSARTIANAGATATATASVRQNLASQIQALQQELLSAANTSFGGRFIFGGDQDQTPPYAADSTSPTGVSATGNLLTSRVILNPSGQTVYQALSAQQIFDQRAADGTATSNNAFAALSNLRTALAGNDVPGITAALDSLSNVADWLGQEQAYYGRSGDRIHTEQTTTDNQILSLKTQISGIRDTDFAQAASDLTQETTALQAALAAQGQISRKSLFDYLG